MDDDKNKIMIAVLAFNVVVMAYMIVQYFVLRDPDVGFSWWHFPIALVLGAVAGGAAFGLASLRK